MTNFYQHLLDKTCMVSSSDARGIIRYVNDKFCTESGYSAKELIGQSYSIFKSGEHDERFYSKMWEEISAGRSWRGRICNKTKQGQLLWTELFIVPETIDGTLRFNSFHVLEAGGLKDPPAYADDLYHSLVDNLPVSIWRKDTSGKISFVNKYLLQISGMAERDLLGKTNYDLYPKKQADRYSKHDKIVLESGKAHKATDVLRNPITGEKIFIETIKIPIPDSKGGFSGIQGVFWDITERTDATKRIAQSERYYKKLVERINEMFFLCDKKGNPFYASGSIEDLTGYTVEEIVQMNYQAVVHQDYQKLVKATLEEVGSSPGNSATIQVLVRIKAGKWRWMEAIVSNYIQDADISAIVVNVRDIQHLKQAEETLKFHSRLLQEVSEAIIALDNDSRILTWNKAAEQLYGWSKEEVLGKRFSDLIESEFVNCTKTEVTEALETSGSWEGETLQQTRSGKYFYFLSSVSLIADDKGIRMGAVVVNRNITERKEFEKHMLRQNEKLTEIAWLHAHKIRGPVATIMGLMNIYNWDDFSSPDNLDIVRKVDQVSKQLDLIIHEVVKKTGELDENRTQDDPDS